MTKGKSKTAKSETAASRLPKDFTLEDIAGLIREERNAPINRAYQKFLEFVNAAVQDPDFRHEDSRALLMFLLGARDQLLDGITPEWTIGDIVKPITDDATRKARDGKNGPLGEAKAYVIREWLAQERKRGEKTGFALEVLDRAMEISGRKIAEKTIRENWLSAKSIESWRKDHGE